MSIDARIDGYNWAQVFGEEIRCSDVGDGYPSQHKLDPKNIPGDSSSKDPFSRDDVSEILHIFESRDGGYAEWDGVCVVRLNDGRFASLEGGCDTTGWG